MLFNYFEVFNEGIIGREVEMRRFFCFSFFGGPKAPLSSMIVFTISTSLQIILNGAWRHLFYFFYFFLGGGGGGGVARLGALYNIDFAV